MSSFNKIIPLVLLACIFVIGLPFVSSIMGSVDEGVDMSGSDYEDQYNATTDTSITTLAMLGPIPLIVGVVVLILGVLTLKTLKRR